MQSSGTDTTDHDSLLQRLKAHSLKAAGFGYLVGDAALFAAGVMEHNFRGASVGLWWGLGGLATARYGNPSSEKQLELLSARLGRYLQAQGIAIPADPTAQKLLKPGGVIEHLESFLYAHPSEVLNGVYAIGATQLLRSGIQKKFTSDIASGALIGAGALAGLLIPERKPDPAHPPQDAMGRLAAWAQEKPLRVSGAFYHTSNITTLMGAFAKRRECPELGSYLPRFLTAGSYIFANTMLELSSRHNLHDTHAQIAGELADLSAYVIAAQPREVQEALVERIAGYLSTQKEISQSAAEISDLLHARLRTVEPVAIASWKDRVEPSAQAPDVPAR